MIAAAPVALAILASVAACSQDALDPTVPQGHTEVRGGLDSTASVWNWEPCSGGSPAVRYEVAVRPRGEDWQTDGTTDTTATSIRRTDDYQVRVRGIDARGRSGPWSQPSEWSEPQVAR